MTRVENLIVEGKCFFPLDDSKQHLKLKQLITDFMVQKNFAPQNTSSYFLENKFLTMAFFLNLFTYSFESKLSKQIKDFLNPKNKLGMAKENYDRILSRTREDIPFRVTFYIIPSKLENNNGFHMQIRSEPTVLFQIRNLGIKPPVLDEFRYSDIIETNKQFINEIMYGLGGMIIEKPKVIAEVINTPFIDLLKNLGFEKISTLLKQGNLKIERGDIEDGLTDLRGALEQFIKELVQKIGENPQDNIPSNLDILKKYGYIDEHLYSLIKNNLYEWIYRYISDTCVHKREKISMSNAKLLFSISENIMNYLIEKVVYRK